MKLKSVIFIIILSFAVSFTGCAGDGPDDTVEEFLKVYKENNLDALSGYMASGICAIDSKSANQNESTKLMWKSLSENFEYEILETEISEDEETAVVNVKMSNIWMSKIIMVSFSEYNNFSSLGEDADEKEIAAVFSKILKKYIDEYKNKERFEGTAVIDIIKEDEKWKIVNDTSVFDLMTGEYMTFMSRNLEDFAYPDGNRQ